MPTIDWPFDLTQTYVNTDAEGVRIDDDHQAVGKHSMHASPADARLLAAAHRAVADALEAAADHLGNPAA